MKTIKMIAQASLFFAMLVACKDPEIDPKTIIYPNTENFTANLTAFQSHVSPISYDPLVIHVDIMGKNETGIYPEVTLSASHLLQPTEGNMQGINQYDGQFTLAFPSGETLRGTYWGCEIVNNNVPEGELVAAEYLKMMMSQEFYSCAYTLNISQQYTITGGTGRYVDASGILTVTINDYNSTDSFLMSITGYISTPDKANTN